MLKSMKKTLVGAALLAMSGLQCAQATPVLVQDFWGKDASNQEVHFARLVVDTQAATQWNGSIFQASSWKSFTIFGNDVQTPAFNFLAEFDLSNLVQGFTFLQFDVTDVNNQYSFFGYSAGSVQTSYYDLRDATLPYSDPESEIFVGANVRSPQATVDSPIGAGLLALGVFGLFARRRVARAC